MSRSPLAAFVLACACGCATPRAVAPAPEPASPVRPEIGSKARAQPSRRARKAPEATRSVELESALARFGAQARALRNQGSRGRPMPLAQAANWEQVIDTVDTFLARPAERTSSFDIIRARVVLEAELELDARSYGDIPVELAEDVTGLISRLATRMAEVRMLGVKTRERKVTFAWPVSPVALSSLFGRRLHPITKVYKVHLGVDLAATHGQLVSAAGPGVVTFAGWNGGHGKHVEVQHPGGVTTRYSHLSQILVEVGARLERGDPIGLAGRTGRATGVHLHFEFLRDGRHRDPLEEMGRPVEEVGPIAWSGGGAALGGRPMKRASLH